jgi:hypothetical protein
MSYILLSLLPVFELNADWISGGIKGGLSLTSSREEGFNFGRYGAQRNFQQNRGTVGPYFEFRPSHKLPILETGFLYRHLRLNRNSGPAPSGSYNFSTFSGTAWEIPLLLKIHRNWAFISAGSTLRYIGDLAFRNRQVPIFPGFDPILTSSSLQSDAGLRYGATLALGATKTFHHLKLEPEFRYTRWTSKVLLPNQNQLDFLLGIRF